MLRHADYLPLEVRGQRAEHVVAFARRDENQWVIVIGTRLFASLELQAGEAPIGAVWGDTEIVWPEADAAIAAARGAWLVDAVSGQRHAVEGSALPLARLLRDFPVAALSGEAPQS
jgi:(1->4)-alpha-D-glucan 1-alpha-D-glucosylmutase